MSLTSATSRSIHVGQVLGGKYRVESLLGDGGMGVVLGAVNVDLDQPVALKLLNAASATEPGLVARFLREGRAAARLRSEHIARVLDCGTFEDGRAYLVTERLEGMDLHRFIAAPSEVSVGLAVDLVMQACDGLAEAHAAGIVHRDLKPANLFLTATVSGLPLVKILDFGICKLVSDGDAPSLTKANELLGTPRYMSPEQLIASRDTDARTDIWALGVILYELITKRSPFDGERLSALMNAVATHTPAPLHEVRPDVPPELSKVVQRCLEKKRDARFRDVLELSCALADYGLGRRPSTPVWPPRAPMPEAEPAAVAFSTQRLDEDQAIDGATMALPPRRSQAPSPDLGVVSGATLVSAQDGDGPSVRPAKPLVSVQSSAHPSAGRFGKYVLHGPLARGGMATVFYGTVMHDGAVHPVALKRVRADLTDPNLATMLADEARIAARVQHPNVVGTLDVVVDDGDPMIVLEYVSGVSLSQLMRRTRSLGTRIPVGVAVALATDALAGLHAAHEAVDLAGQPLEIVHRDVSPANILLDERGIAKIADFGVAHARGRLQKTTETGAMKGKLGYLAPEQIYGTSSRASDIYAVGVVLWEMLVGRPLFQGVGGELLAAALLGKVTPPSSEGRPEASALDPIVMKALAHDAGRRYSTAQQMIEALKAVVTPATHAEIAAFLEANAGDDIARRRAEVSAILANATREDAPPEVRAPEAKPRWRWALWAALFFVPLFVVASVVARGGRGRAIAEPSAGSASGPSAGQIAPPLLPAVLPVAGTSVEAGAESSATPASDPEPATSTVASAVSPRVAPRPKKPPAKGVSCSPPYDVKEDGRRIWKRECFQK